MTRAFLIANALVWIPYGLYCLVVPGALAGIAGVAATTTTGTVELRAMYGGVQAALGMLAAVALVRADLERTALVALAFACGGLFTGRLLGAVMAGEFSSYTAIALVFESGTCAAAAWLLARRDSARLSA